MKSKAKEKTIQDIKEDLMQEGKCFLAFRKKLNPTIGNMVRKYINSQRRITKTK